MNVAPLLTPMEYNMNNPIKSLIKKYRHLTPWQKEQLFIVALFMLIGVVCVHLIDRALTAERKLERRPKEVIIIKVPRHMDVDVRKIGCGRFSLEEAIEIKALREQNKRHYL